jgi:hypothetical protein
VAFGLRIAAGVGLPAQADAAHLMAVGRPAMAFYLDKLIWPVDIAPLIHFGWLPPVPWLSGVIAFGLLAVVATVYGPFARAGLVFAFLGLLPAWAAVAHVGAVVDRYLYLPMVGIAWAVAAIAQRPLGRYLTTFALIGCVAASAKQVPVWKNEATLWKAVLERAPSGYAAGALARWLEDNGQVVDAAHWYEVAVQPPRAFHESCYNVTRVHLKLNQPAEAIRVGRAALAAGCEPSPELVAPLALALALEGEWEEANEYAQSVGSDPTGKAVIVRLAAQAQAGNLKPLNDAMNTTDGVGAMQIQKQVIRVLEHAGAQEAVARILDSAGAPDSGDSEDH